MASAGVTMEISASPADVWGVIGDPASLGDWHPAVESSNVDGSARVVALEGGGEFKETITEHSDDARTYSYDILECPLPINGAHSRIAVTEAGDGSSVSWSVDFEPDDPAAEQELTAEFNGIYQAGLEAARERCE